MNLPNILKISMSENCCFVVDVRVLLQHIVCCTSMSFCFRIGTFSIGKHPLTLKGMSKEYNINDSSGCCANASRILCPKRSMCKNEKSTEELPAALGATWVGPLCKCGCLSADCWSVLKRAFSSVSTELGYEVAY